MGKPLTVGIRCSPGHCIHSIDQLTLPCVDPGSEMEACLVMGERDVLDMGEIKSVGAHAKGRCL